MAHDLILATWAVCAAIVGAMVWNDGDVARSPFWERVGGSALLGIFGGGVIAALGLLAVGLIAAVV